MKYIASGGISPSFLGVCILARAPELNLYVTSEAFQKCFFVIKFSAKARRGAFFTNE